MYLLFCPGLGFKHGLVCPDFHGLSSPTVILRDLQISPRGFKKSPGVSRVYFQMFLATWRALSFPS